MAASRRGGLVVAAAVMAAVAGPAWGSRYWPRVPTPAEIQRATGEKLSALKALGRTDPALGPVGVTSAAVVKEYKHHRAIASGRPLADGTMVEKDYHVLIEVRENRVGSDDRTVAPRTYCKLYELTCNEKGKWVLGGGQEMKSLAEADAHFRTWEAQYRYKPGWAGQEEPELEGTCELGMDVPLSPPVKCPPAAVLTLGVKKGSNWLIRSVAVRQESLSATGVRQTDSIFRVSEETPTGRFEVDFTRLGGSGKAEGKVGFAEVNWDLVEEMRFPVKVKFLCTVELVSPTGGKRRQEVEIEKELKGIFQAHCSVAGPPTPAPPPMNRGIPELGGQPVPLGQGRFGVPGDVLRLPQKAHVAVVFLDGTVGLFVLEQSSDLYEDLLFRRGAKGLPRVTDREAARLAVEIGREAAVDRAQEKIRDAVLQMLIKSAKRASGAGVLLDVLGALGGTANPKSLLRVRLRSTVGLTVGTGGSATVRNFEGSPEVLLPDGKALPVPEGQEVARAKGGSFGQPRPIDRGGAAVRMWEKELTADGADRPARSAGPGWWAYIQWPVVGVLAAAVAVVVVVVLRSRRRP